MAALRRLDAYGVFILNSGLSSVFFLMVFTAGVVYQVDLVGLTPIQLVLVGTTLEASVFLFEVPTGVVADVYGRRLSVIIGTFLLGAGFLLEGAIPLFATILVAQVLWGIGYTFTSGATQAWIADEVGEDEAGPAFVRGAQAGQIGSFVGILAGVGLGSLRINLPILVGGGLFVALAILLLFIMPERNFRPSPKAGRSAFAHMADTARGGLGLVRTRPILYTILGVSLFYGLSSEGFDRLSTALLLRDIGLPAFWGLPPVVWIGMIDGGALLLGTAATEFARRRVDTSGTRGPVLTLLFSSVVTVAALIVFGLTSNFAVAWAMLWLIMPLREVVDPFHLAWLNRQLESEVRATAISLESQTHALGEILGGPIAGLVASVFSVRAAMLAAAALLVPTVALLGLALRPAAPSIEVKPAAQPADTV